MENTTPSSVGTGLYHDSIRRSFATLVHATHAIEAARRHEGEGVYLRKLGHTLAAFVDQVIWADHEVQLGEYQALSVLAEEDSRHGGFLADGTRAQDLKAVDLHRLPEIIGACRDYDVANGTRLAKAAIDAFESLGLSIIASDRTISDTEFEFLQAIMHNWRSAEEGMEPGLPSGWDGTLNEKP